MVQANIAKVVGRDIDSWFEEEYWEDCCRDGETVMKNEWTERQAQGGWRSEMLDGQSSDHDKKRRDVVSGERRSKGAMGTRIARR
jgi:hypothetical protein